MSPWKRTWRQGELGSGSFSHMLCGPAPPPPPTPPLPASVCPSALRELFHLPHGVAMGISQNNTWQHVGRCLVNSCVLPAPSPLFTCEGSNYLPMFMHVLHTSPHPIPQHRGGGVRPLPSFPQHTGLLCSQRMLSTPFLPGDYGSVLLFFPFPPGLP